MTEISLTDIALTTLDGRPTTLSQLVDGAALVVNVASKCGLTPQYTALEHGSRRARGDRRDRGSTAAIDGQLLTMCCKPLGHLTLPQ